MLQNARVRALTVSELLWEKQEGVKLPHPTPPQPQIRGNGSRFLAEVSTKLQKMYFLRQFKNYNSGRKQGN